jgi:hypothetical protein
MTKKGDQGAHRSVVVHCIVLTIITLLHVLDVNIGNGIICFMSCPPCFL